MARSRPRINQTVSRINGSNMRAEQVPPQSDSIQKLLSAKASDADFI